MTTVTAEHKQNYLLPPTTITLPFHLLCLPICQPSVPAFPHREQHPLLSQDQNILAHQIQAFLLTMAHLPLFSICILLVLDFHQHISIHTCLLSCRAERFLPPMVPVGLNLCLLLRVKPLERVAPLACCSCQRYPADEPEARQQQWLPASH